MPLPMYMYIQINVKKRENYLYAHSQKFVVYNFIKNKFHIKFQLKNGIMLITYLVSLSHNYHLDNFSRNLWVAKFTESKGRSFPCEKERKHCVHTHHTGPIIKNAEPFFLMELLLYSLIHLIVGIIKFTR